MKQPFLTTSSPETAISHAFLTAFNIAYPQKGEVSMNVFANILKKRKKENFNYTIIAGCGRLGASLARTLSDNGGDVIIIDKNPNAFQKLSSSFGGIVMTGDATDMLVLNEAEIKKATAVISVTNNDNTNIMVAQLAKELFNIEYVIARLYDSDRECIYQEFGIDTICPAELSTKEIYKLLGVSEKVEDAK